MITNLSQRWSDGSPSYRPAGEPIRTADYDVVAMSGKDARAIEFVERHHYSRSYPAGRFAYGLFKGQQLQGVAVFSVPPNAATLTNVFHCGPDDATELGRFVLLDGVPANGETYFLARAFEQLRREGLAGVVSFSDPVARASADGQVIHRGHVGTIYQAHNAVFLGRGTARTLRVLRDGTVFNDRTAQKIRKAESGWHGAVRTLVEKYGADQLGAQDPREWLSQQISRLTYRLPHPGNYKYAWGLQKSVKRALPKSLPYPKVMVAS